MNKKLGIIFVILAGVCWGSAAMFVSVLADGFTSYELALTRCAVSAIASLTLTLVTDPKSLRINKNQILPTALLGLSFFFMAAFYYMAISNSTATTAAIIINLAPLVVMVYSTVFFREKFTLQKGLALGMALVGCVLVTGIVNGISFKPIGIAFGFLSCACYATYSICVSIVTKSGVSAKASTAYTFTLATVVAMFFANPVTYAQKVVASPWYIILALVGFGFVTGFMASFLYSNGMRCLPAGVVASMSALEPLTSALTSVIFLGEILTVWAVIGVVLILLSVPVLNMSFKRFGKKED